MHSGQKTDVPLPHQSKSSGVSLREHQSSAPSWDKPLKCREYLYHS